MQYLIESNSVILLLLIALHLNRSYLLQKINCLLQQAIKQYLTTIKELILY